MHDTVTKTSRHLSFFQHERHLRLRTPRVKLPGGSVRLVGPDFAGRLSGFTYAGPGPAIAGGRLDG